MTNWKIGDKARVIADNKYGDGADEIGTEFVVEGLREGSNGLVLLTTPGPRGYDGFYASRCEHVCLTEAIAEAPRYAECPWCKGKFQSNIPKPGCQECEACFCSDECRTLFHYVHKLVHSYQFGKAPPERTEAESFCIEAALWYGFKTHDDDDNQMVATENQVIALVKAARDQGRRDEMAYKPLITEERHLARVTELLLANNREVERRRAAERNLEEARVQGRLDVLTPIPVTIERYEHHGVEVSVFSHLKGTHRSACLCFSGCKRFRPGEPDNCQIADANYRLCVEYNIVAPVGECPKYEAQQ